MFRRTLRRLFNMSGVPTARSLTAAADLPTIPQLYELGFITPLDKDVVSVTPSAKVNKAVGLIRADITKLDVDAIVNAANKSLLGGGGVDGAIHRAAGRGLYRECRTLGGCPTGGAKITDAYDLPCKKVIHTVGPVYYEDEAQEAKEELRSCYNESLKRAVENDCRTVVFSCISTGIYGYPSNKAAPLACRTIRTFLEGPDGERLDKVIFCLFEMKDVEAYRRALPKYFPPTEQTAQAGQQAEGSTEKKQAEESIKAGKNTEAQPSASKEAEAQNKPSEGGESN